MMGSQEINQQQSSNAITMVAAAAFAGILGALGTILFRKLVAFVHNVFFLGHFSFIYNENLHTPESLWGVGIVLVPIIGGLFVIWLIENFAFGQRGLSVPEVMDAIFCKDGRIQPSVALAKIIASAVTIGTGGSVGREGPVFQLGATLSSIVSDFTHLSIQQRKVLIAAGVAACTAVIFHAPLGGIVFATEFLLTQFSVFAILLIIIATTLAITVEYILFGLEPIFSLQIVNQISENVTFYNAFIFVIFGIAIGLISIIFIRGVYWFVDIFNKFLKNAYLRHLLGMSIVGCMLFLLMTLFGHYYIQGIGFSTIQDCLNNHILNPWLLLLLVLAKLLATCLTLGSGASGGIFSPLLFIGATLGSAFGIIMHYLFPAFGVDPVLFTLVGMAAMLGCTTGALITSIVLISEMMNNFHFILPIIITVLIAYIVRHCLCQENIYTLKLHRRGIDLHRRFYN